MRPTSLTLLHPCLPPSCFSALFVLSRNLGENRGLCGYLPNGLSANTQGTGVGTACSNAATEPAPTAPPPSPAAAAAPAPITTLPDGSPTPPVIGSPGPSASPAAAAEAPAAEEPKTVSVSALQFHSRVATVVATSTQLQYPIDNAAAVGCTQGTSCPASSLGSSLRLESQAQAARGLCHWPSIDFLPERFPDCLVNCQLLCCR